jgi:NTP pyrophosphatase (non-canonical NTP hydrolase)
MSIVSNVLLAELLQFRRLRDWEKFHTPRNLAASLVIEASELLECFQWAKDDELNSLVVEERQRIEDEIADVAILLSYICSDLHVDINSAVKKKILKNGEKYPVEKSRGNSKKYDKL